MSADGLTAPGTEATLRASCTPSRGDANGKRSVTLRLFDEGDRAGLNAVYEEAFGAEALARFTRRWQWQFVNNPAAALAPRMLWVAELDGRIVGCLSSHLSRLKIGDRELPHRYSNDLAVSGSARGWGLGTRLIGAYFNAVTHLATALYFTPTNRRIHDRHGYQPVDIYPLLVRPVRPSALLEFERNAGRLPSWLSREPLATASRGGAAVGELLLAGANRVLRPSASRRYRVVEATAATEEFTHLWTVTRGEFPITAVRDQAYVQWRFFDDPAFEHTVLEGRDRTGTLCGYVAISTSLNRGLRVGRIVDLFCSPREPDLVDALLREAIRRLEASGVDVVSSLGMDERLRRQLSRYLYLRPSSRQFPVLVAWRGGDADRPLIFDSANYHLTGADGDQWFAP